MKSFLVITRLFLVITRSFLLQYGYKIHVEVTCNYVNWCVLFYLYFLLNLILSQLSLNLQANLLI